MRHISMDESSVLGEFFKIAEEKNLLGIKKEAEEKRGYPFLKQINYLNNYWMRLMSKMNPERARGMYDREVKRIFNRLQNKYSSKPIYKQPLSVFIDLANQAGPGNAPLPTEEEYESSVNASSDTEINKEAAQYPFMKQLNYLNKFWANLRKNMSAEQAEPKFRQELNKVHGILKRKYTNPMYSQVVAQFPALAMQFTQQEADDGIGKEAADKSDKFYDVIDETGEDLINSAHPGNTKTELSHSKTDENLVETVVEQQKKDIEVAKKIPKGVFAALSSLADKLDSIGYVKAANEVDKIIQKSADVGYDAYVSDTLARKLVDSVEDNLSFMSKYNGKLKEWASKYNNLDIKVVENKLQGLAKNDPGLAEALNTALRQTAKDRQEYYASKQNVSKPYAWQQPGKGPGFQWKATRPEEGVGGEEAEDLKLRPIAGSKRVMNWQKFYNAAIKGTGLKPLKVDGMRGPNTNAALKAVKDSGARTLAEFRNKIMNQPKVDKYIPKATKETNVPESPGRREPNATMPNRLEYPGIGMSKPTTIK